MCAGKKCLGLVSILEKLTYVLTLY
jgi:hypothetical protein